MSERQCPNCGEPTAANGSARRYCNVSCQREHLAEPNLCTECGELIVRSRRPGRQPTVCGATCKAARRRRVGMQYNREKREAARLMREAFPVRQCIECKAVLPIGAPSQRKLCSNTCRHRRKERLRKKAETRVKPCAHCGENFAIHRKSQMHCSTACKEARRLQVEKDRRAGILAHAGEGTLEEARAILEATRRGELW